jgi:hypothetical protein
MITEVQSRPLTDKFLAGLDRDALVDFLQHRTDLLLSSVKTDLRNRVYNETLRQEVKKIQSALRSKDK